MSGDNSPPIRSVSICRITTAGFSASDSTDQARREVMAQMVAVSIAPAMQT